MDDGYVFVAAALVAAIFVNTQTAATNNPNHNLSVGTPFRSMTY